MIFGHEDPPGYVLGHHLPAPRWLRMLAGASLLFVCCIVVYSFGRPW